MSFVKPSEIIESFNLYGSEMVVLDLEKMRESGNKKVKYVNAMLKKADGKLAPMRVKFINQKINNNIKDIEDRSYEQIKLSFKEGSEFTEALCLVAESFTEQVGLLNGKRITNDRKKASKECILMPSVEPKVPVQTTALDKEGEVVDLDEPIIWVRMNSKRYSPSETDNLVSLDGSYKESGAPLLVKQFEFDTVDFSSGSPVKTSLNFENCSDAFTRNTIVSGIINLQAISSVQGGFNLNASFYRTLYYITADKDSYGDNSFEEDEFAEMAAMAKAQPQTQTQTETKPKEEFDESVDLSDIANLTLE